MDWIATIVVGVLAFAGTLVGALLANRKSAALIAYRLSELEKKDKGRDIKSLYINPQ